jgi:IS605 OrfB family transposase
VKPHCAFPDKFTVSESKLIKKKNCFYIHVIIQKEITQKESCSSILAIDLGERVIATVCNSQNMRPIFMGREVRGIRRHFAWLRKRLGEKRLLKEIKRIGQKEQRVVDAYLHGISRRIVEEAARTDSVIVFGDLKGIRSAAKGKGRRFNRIVSNMPYYKLSQMIQYKARWEGIPVLKINERGTSKTCSKCGSEGKRPYQGLFKCNECGYQANADFNGSKNILKMAAEYIFVAGVSVNAPITEPF